MATAVASLRIWGNFLPWPRKGIWDDFPPFHLLGFDVIFRLSVFRGNFLQFYFLEFGVNFRHSVFRHSAVPAYSVANQKRNISKQEKRIKDSTSFLYRNRYSDV